MSAPIKTGKKQGLKVSYDEGLSSHISPESCAGNGNIIGEALTGESAGWSIRKTLAAVKRFSPATSRREV